MATYYRRTKEHSSNSMTVPQPITSRARVYLAPKLVGVHGIGLLGHIIARRKAHLTTIESEVMSPLTQLGERQLDSYTLDPSPPHCVAQALV